MDIETTTIRYSLKYICMLEYNVAARVFYIWKLELWWVAFDSPAFYPEGRKHLKAGWFWRKNKPKNLK